MVNPPGSRNASFRTAPDNPPDPADWLNRSTTAEGGSWWPDFARWLKQRGGGRRPTPAARRRRLQPLDAAPGTYVLDR